MITFNSPDPNVTDARRFMIGRYSDNEFGEIQANIFTQIRPFTTNFTISNDATFESAVLTLCFDQYWYGPSVASTHSFEVHELTDSIITENAYFFNSRVSFSPTVLGSEVYTVNPDVFKKSQELNNDSDQLNNVVDSVAITLDPTYGEALFRISQANGDEFRTFRKFRQIFKGLAIMPGAGDKIVGINPDFEDDTNTRKSITKTRLTVYYNTPNA
ncbi:MAG: DUF4270 domain-containing protein, partial [Cyclobacteriaceae bacterium]|nr:DUF4270 domain-containing protein [Cyclobacteriaceae bacterium]